MRRYAILLALGMCCFAPAMAASQGVKKNGVAKVGEIIVVGDANTRAEALRKAIQLYPGATLDDAALQRAEKSLGEFGATIKVLDSKKDGFKDILITLKQGAGKKDTPKKADPLEQLIAEALKNNPDIRVADARLRAAEAEASRARMKLISELTALHADIEAAEAGVKEGEARYERAKKLYDQKVIPAEDLGTALLTFVKLKTELAGLKARLPYLLGRQSAEGNAKLSYYAPSQALVIKSSISDEDFARRVSLDVLGRVPTVEEMKAFLAMPAKDRREKWVEQLQKANPVQAWEIAVRVDRILVEKYWQGALKVPESPLTEKLRKALDGTIRLGFQDAPPAHVFEFIRQTALPGINLAVRVKMKKDPITISLPEPVPVGAALQYLEDELGVIFVLREYGIVVVAADERLPPDAVRVIDFWKHGAKAKPVEKK
jgi:hypothetical protein